MQAQETPRRRGRPRKTIPITTSQFPGIVVPISSVPRLRPGVICEVVGCVQCHANNGRRVVIESIDDNGGLLVRAVDALLVTINSQTGALNDALLPTAVFQPKNLYRIGSLKGKRHV